jgi:hypothetical protein
LFAHVTPTVEPVTAGELNELFFAADPNERRLILLNLDVVAPLPPDRTGLARDPSASERLEAAALAAAMTISFGTSCIRCGYREHRRGAWCTTTSASRSS